MLPDGRDRLIGGPYEAPRVRIGGWLMDEIDGLVEVGGWSSGPMAWPRRKKTGRASLILCGALVDAVRSESALAVAAHWGVAAGTVAKWRHALGVDRRNNAGTQGLYAAYKPIKLSEDRAASGRAAASTPDARARMARSKAGKPAAPETRARLLRAAKAPKPEGWGARANAWMRRTKNRPTSGEEI